MYPKIWATGFLLFMGLLGCSKDDVPGEATPRAQPQDAMVLAAQQCVQASPLLGYGEGLQRPAIAQPTPEAQLAHVSQQGACAGNRAFRFGAARADITGPSGGKILMGNENIDNYAIGVHMRLFARAFVVESPCNQKRVAIVLTDTGMVFGAVRDAVLEKIRTDPSLARAYSTENLLISATHTHSGPGGYSHYEAYNFFRFGFDQQAFDVIVQGIVRALREAHGNLERAASTGQIGFAEGELLGANVSRSPEVYRSNPAGERARYQDVDGSDLDTNRLMTLLRLVRDDGKEVGSMNWFAVHPTSDNLLGQFGEPISGDNKGYAMFVWERMMASGDAEPFVSSFQQSDSGDVFSYLWHRNPQEQNKRYAKLLNDAHPGERHPLTVANGTAQLAQALRLYQAANKPLVGGVDYRFGMVKMDSMQLTDPVIIDSLQHPPELDSKIKETCNPSLGYSFLAGGRGAAPGEIGKNARMGVTCQNSGNNIGGLVNDLKVAMAGKVPTESAAYALGCQAPKLAALNLQCQAEKPVFLLFGPPVNVSPTILPFQLVRIGNLAIVAIPWEVTTMAGRRIRQTVLDALREDGVDHVVINGLSNDFVNYLTTREEYAVQGYEGASNQFGPWSLAVVQQEMRRLAQGMAQGKPVDPGPTPPRKEPTVRQVAPFNAVDFAQAGFGTMVQEPGEVYAPGETARAVFRTADPNNDLLIDDTFLKVERQGADGQWVVVATDRDPETTFLWTSPQPRPQFLPSPVSEAEIIWRIPRNARAGIYRLVHQGSAMAPGATEPQRFEGRSRSFEVKGAVAMCP
ncbi:MAG TPA: neutral/alkaline non-lysosomal ceramidase N-terminal domain-containing protein [Limnobacter sp.]|nr:neutral/alkaline non-lysosomal ceramidase N-terminal domain-containing protein [Limnobacter sp.]